MSDSTLDFIFKFIAAPIAMLMIAFLCFALFVYFPVSLYTEAECLRNGYPKAKVSIGLERYCMNLDGTVTVKVEKAGK